MRRRGRGRGRRGKRGGREVREENRTFSFCYYVYKYFHYQ